MPENKISVIIAGENQSKSAFSELESSLDKLVSKFDNFGKVLEALAIAKVTAKIFEFGKQAIESEVNLAKMSQRTGIAIDQLSEMAYAANLSGVSTDVFEKAVK